MASSCGATSTDADAAQRDGQSAAVVDGLESGFRFAPEFNAFMLSLQRLVQQGRTDEAQSLLQRAFGMGAPCTAAASSARQRCDDLVGGCVCRVPPLVAAVWALALVDVGDAEKSRAWTEKWLQAEASHAQMEALTDAGHRAVAAADHARLLHVYAAEILVPAGCEDIATRVVADDAVVNEDVRETLLAAVATAVASRDAALEARANRAKKRAAAAATAAAAAARAVVVPVPAAPLDATEGVSAAGAPATSSEVSPARFGNDGVLVGVESVVTDAPAQLLRRAQSFVAWLTTLLAAGPGSRLDPARVAAAVAAAVLVLGIVRRVSSTVVGGRAISVTVRELAWAVEKALAGLV
jgi:hypothetical protein